MKTQNWLCSKNMIFTLRKENKACNNHTFFETRPSSSAYCASERERHNHRKSESFHACIGGIPDLLVLLASLQGVQYTCYIFLRLQCDHYTIVRATVQVQYFQDMRRAGVACRVAVKSERAACSHQKRYQLPA
jgi:hypothetical protein